LEIAPVGRASTARGTCLTRYPTKRGSGRSPRCAFYGLNPDEPALMKGQLIPLWKCFRSRAVIDAADAADRATPVMEKAGVAALNSGAADPGALVH
jgi:hypothetical protein